MRIPVALTPAVLSIAVCLLAACDGGDGEADATPTSTATVRATATETVVPTATALSAATASPVPAATGTPVPAPTAAEAPHAAAIEVDPGVNNLGEGVIQPVVAAGGVFNLDPVDAALDLGIAPPPCAGFVFYLTWQVCDPYPPEGVDIELYWTRMGGTELIGAGPSGQASRGCGEIQVRNNSAFEVAVEIRYAIGEIPP